MRKPHLSPTPSSKWLRPPWALLRSGSPGTLKITGTCNNQHRQGKFLHCSPPVPLVSALPCRAGHQNYTGLFNLASVSPSSTKLGVAILDVNGEDVEDTWVLRRRDLWRGRVPFLPTPKLRLPRIPSPAHHLILPDNGTSMGGASAISPGPSLRKGVSLKIPEKRHGGQPGLGPSAPAEPVRDAEA